MKNLKQLREAASLETQDAAFRVQLFLLFQQLLFSSLIETVASLFMPLPCCIHRGDGFIGSPGRGIGGKMTTFVIYDGRAAGRIYRTNPTRTREGIEQKNRHFMIFLTKSCCVALYSVEMWPCLEFPTQSDAWLHT